MGSRPGRGTQISEVATGGDCSCVWSRERQHEVVSANVGEKPSRIQSLFLEGTAAVRVKKPCGHE